MQYLEKVNASPTISFYRISGDYAGKIKRYIVSTKQSRLICNKPELLGCKYTQAMEAAVRLTLEHLPEKESLLMDPEERFCVFHYLRGGLNFGIRSALNKAYGFNRHASAFMTSQRAKENERWFIKENQYRKLKVPDQATLLIGDVVATGTTITQGFDIFYKFLQENKLKIKNLIFFTIGCHKLEKVLEEFDTKLRQLNPSYQETIIIYFEGKFKLVDSKTSFKIQLPGTDLVRTPALVAPEFALSQYEHVSHPLERCTIYDAGSRSFDIPEYLEDVKGYWEKVGKLAEQGFTLYDALRERWPEQGWESYEHFAEHKKKEWRGVDEAFLKTLHEAYLQRWSDEFTQKAKSNGALKELCKERLAILQ